MAKKKKATVPESYSAEIRRETQLALGRIGKKQIDQLRWLVEFAAVDLDACSAGRLADLGWEVVAFSFDEVPEQPIDLHVAFDLEPRVQLPVEEIRRFHLLIQKGLDDFFDGKGWGMTEPEVFKRLKVNVRPFHVESIKGGSLGWYNKRLRYAFRLVEVESERLQLCSNPKCRKRFVAEKKGRTKFCSSRCSNYIHVLVHRARGEFEARPERKRLKGRALGEAWGQLLRQKLGIVPDAEVFAIAGDDPDPDSTG